MGLVVEEVKKVMKNTELDANTLLVVMDRQNLNHMVKIGNNVRMSLMDDYVVVQSLSVKQIILEDYLRINRNIKAVEHALKFYGFGFSLN